MTAEEAATAFLEGRLQPLQTALRIMAAYHDLPRHPIWKATGGASGPLGDLYVAGDEVDRIGYIGPDPEWWHPAVRAAKAADLAETQQRMQPRIRAACLAIIEHG